MREITIKIAGECEEAVLAALLEKGFDGAATLPVPPSADGGIHFYLKDREWQIFKPDLTRKLRQITSIFKVLPAEISEKNLDGQDWENSWKRYAKSAIQIT
jgi:ribosomal protein L11 methylase PrmA